MIWIRNVYRLDQSALNAVTLGTIAGIKLDGVRIKLIGEYAVVVCLAGSTYQAFNSIPLNGWEPISCSAIRHGDPWDPEHPDGGLPEEIKQKLKQGIAVHVGASPAPDPGERELVIPIPGDAREITSLEKFHLIRLVRYVVGAAPQAEQPNYLADHQWYIDYLVWAHGLEDLTPSLIPIGQLDTSGDGTVRPGDMDANKNGAITVEERSSYLQRLTRWLWSWYA